MVRADVLTLIVESPQAHGVHESITASERTVLCTVRSVGMTESYTAMGHGLAPEWVFVLTHAFEYEGEKRCRFQGVDYRIIRTYVTEADSIELTVERSNQCLTTS